MSLATGSKEQKIGAKPQNLPEIRIIKPRNSKNSHRAKQSAAEKQSNEIPKIAKHKQPGKDTAFQNIRSFRGVRAMTSLRSDIGGTQPVTRTHAATPTRQTAKSRSQLIPPHE